MSEHLPFLDYQYLWGNFKDEIGHLIGLTLKGRRVGAQHMIYIYTHTQFLRVSHQHNITKQLHGGVSLVKLLL